MSSELGDRQGRRRSRFRRDVKTPGAGMSAICDTLTSMAVYKPSKAEIDREHALINDEIWQAEHPALEELLTGLVDVVTDEDAKDWQLRLLTRMKARQELLPELQGRITALNLELRELVVQRPKPLERIRLAQDELNLRKRQVEIQRALNHVLLALGDCMAWRHLGANRGAISALGQGSRVGWLSSEEGWSSELAAIEQVWNEDGVVAILNDATTCLRLGDVTCVFENRVEVREVKAGKPADSSSPQMQRLRQAVELINNGRVVFEGKDRAIVRSRALYRTLTRDLAPLLVEARANGRAVRKLSSTHLVVASDFLHPVQADLGPFELDDALAAAGWASTDVVLYWGTSLRRMRDRHETFPSLAPVALLPLPVNDVVDLLIGRMDFTTWINVSAVARYLGGRGLAARAVPVEEAGDGFVVVTKRFGQVAYEMHVTPHLREMMAIELMTTATLADLVEALLDASFDDPSLRDAQAMVVPGDERAAWGLPE